MSALTHSLSSLSETELSKLGADEHTLQIKKLLDPVSDPALHWQTTDDWIWMIHATDLLVPEGVTAKSLHRAMLNACLSLGTKTHFPRAINDLQAVSDWLSGSGTKTAVMQAHRYLARRERHRLDAGFSDEQNEVLTAIELLTHTRKPLSHLYGCFHACNAILTGVYVAAPNRVLTDVLRADLPNPFVP